MGFAKFLSVGPTLNKIFEDEEDWSWALLRPVHARSRRSRAFPAFPTKGVVNFL